jgi:Cu+-exporting ATPase
MLVSLCQPQIASIASIAGSMGPSRLGNRAVAPGRARTLGRANLRTRTVIRDYSYHIGSLERAMMSGDAHNGYGCGYRLVGTREPLRRVQRGELGRHCGKCKQRTAVYGDHRGVLCRAELGDGSGGDGGSVEDDETRRDSGGGPGVESSALLKTPESMAEDIVVLDVTGMMCAGCVSRVRQILLDEAYVLGASVNLPTETAVVRVVIDERQASADGDVEEGSLGSHSHVLKSIGENLASLLSDKGYEAKFRPFGTETSAAAKVVRAKREERIKKLREKTLQVIVAWGLASACMIHHIAHWFGVAAPKFVHLLGSTMGTAALSALALLGPGRSIVVDGLKNIVRGSPDMNSLVGLGATTAFGISVVAMVLPRLGWRTFFEEPAMLLGFILLGRALEEKAKIQASADMAALSGLLPPMARVLLSDGASWREIPSENVSSGDLVTILPGDRIPVDGVVIDGRSLCDESSITGEPLPVSKAKGDEVTAGTTNFDGTLTVKCTAAGGDAAISNIVTLVESAQARTAPIQRIADVVAGKFAYGVIGAAAVTFLFWSGIGCKVFPKVLESSLAGGASKTAATIALSVQLACNVLVVACPCALGLAAPTAVLVGTGAGAKKGLLIRGGDVLEASSSVDTIVFDKTGTLTTGRPSVVKIFTSTDEFDANDCLSFAAAIEENSSHPIAKAIMTEATLNGNGLQRRVQSESFNQVPGKGAQGIVDGEMVYIGNQDWVLEKTGAASMDSSLKVTINPGHTHVYIGINKQVVGSIEISDSIREGAKDVLKKLINSGITPVMLSGDQQETAQYVAQQIGISPDNVIAGVTPVEKVEAIRRLRQEKKCIAMVGDGVNDAAALAEADVGIAMGGGVAVASEVSDIVLLGDRLPQVIDVVKLSKMTMDTIRQNMMWAFGYNMICLPLAAGALLPVNGLSITPAISGALMGCSSLAVMANSLLLQAKAKNMKN